MLVVVVVVLLLVPEEANASLNVVKESPAPNGKDISPGVAYRYVLPRVTSWSSIGCVAVQSAG
jgi:hypothetical protein